LVVRLGGGATGLRTRENAVRLIDSAIIKQALKNDAARAVSARSTN
jgi:hypothetical protein